MKRKKKTFSSFAVRVALTVLAVYTVVMLMNLQVQLAGKKQELALLESRYEAVRLEGRELDRRLSMAQDMDYEDVERIAREQLDFVSPDQRVFIDISGR